MPKATGYTKWHLGIPHIVLRVFQEERFYFSNCIMLYYYVMLYFCSQVSFLFEVVTDAPQPMEPLKEAEKALLLSFNIWKNRHAARLRSVLILLNFSHL